MTDQFDRDDLTALILKQKKAKKMTWESIADALSMSPVWTHSACVGMNAMAEDKATQLGTLLDLPEDAVELLQESPTKVWDQTVPTDPCLYRFYEITGVYGPTLKALIHEEFGDGIMSAIDFDMSVTRVPNPKGDRVKVEMSGKYLAYNAW